MITPITMTTGATMVQAYQWVDRARRSLLGGGGLPVPRLRPRATSSPAAFATDWLVWTAISRPAFLCYFQPLRSLR